MNEPKSSHARWYWGCGKQKLGPFSLSELHELVITNRLNPDDMLLKEGASHWVAASSVGELPFLLEIGQGPTGEESSQSEKTIWSRQFLLVLLVCAGLLVLLVGLGYYGWQLVDASREHAKTVQKGHEAIERLGAQGRRRLELEGHPNPNQDVLPNPPPFEPPPFEPPLFKPPLFKPQPIYIMEAKVLKISNNFSSAEALLEVTNKSQCLVAYWCIDMQAYDKDKKILASSFCNGSNLQPDKSIVDIIFFNNVDASNVGSWKMNLRTVNLTKNTGEAIFGAEKHFQLVER
jgi:hypothetical protein